MMALSGENSKTIANLNDKFLGIKNYRGLLASYLLFSWSEMGNTDHTSQFKLVKDPQKKWINDFWMKKEQKLVTLYVKVSTIHDTDKKLEIEGFFWKW